MLKRWAIAGAAAAALVAGATGLAASRANNPNALGPFFLGPKMARAEVIMVYGGTVHDWRLARQRDPEQQAGRNDGHRPRDDRPDGA